MSIIIRQEEPQDFEAVFGLIRQAFEGEEHSDHREQFLVERLRNSDAFVPELSLVAETGGTLAGHILLTKLKIVSDCAEEAGSLALAPVAVLPAYQGNGIGGRLIRAAHEKAREMGFGSVILLGHPAFYPKFGYRPLKEFGIKQPFDVPDECCMAIELTEGALCNISGTVRYPDPFFE